MTSFLGYLVEKKAQTEMKIFPNLREQNPFGQSRFEFFPGKMKVRFNQLQNDSFLHHLQQPKNLPARIQKTQVLKGK